MNGIYRMRIFGLLRIRISQSRWGDYCGERVGGGNDVQSDVVGVGEKLSSDERRWTQIKGGSGFAEPTREGSYPVMKRQTASITGLKSKP